MVLLGVFNLASGFSQKTHNAVAVLFNNDCEYKVYDVIRDENGCFIIMDIEFVNKRVTPVNVYGPSAGGQTVMKFLRDGKPLFIYLFIVGL